MNRVAGEAVTDRRRGDAHLREVKGRAFRPEGTASTKPCTPSARGVPGDSLGSRERGREGVEGAIRLCRTLVTVGTWAG